MTWGARAGLHSPSRGGGLITAIGCLLVAWHTGDNRLDGLAVDPEQVDCGSVRPEVRVVPVQLRNLSDRVLFVRYVQTTCSCTSLPLPRNRLSPGEVVDLGVEWDLRRREGPASSVVKIGYSYPSDDGETIGQMAGAAQLQLRADVEQILSMSPQELQFEARTADAGIMTLPRLDEQPFQITEATSIDRRLKMTVDESDSHHSRLVVEFVPDNSLAGVHESQITVRTTLNEFPVLYIPVQIHE